MPPTPSYEELVPLPHVTRSSSDTDCQCNICHIARMKNKNYLADIKGKSNPKGFPKGKVSTHFPPAMPLQICSKCFCLIGRGKSHICTKTQKQSNISQLARSNSEKTTSKITSDLLKSLCVDSGVSLRGGDINLKTGGSQLPVSMGTPRVKGKRPKFTHDNLKRL